MRGGPAPAPEPVPVTVRTVDGNVAVGPHRMLALVGFILLAGAAAFLAYRVDARVLWFLDVRIVFPIVAVILALAVPFIVRKGDARWVAGHSVLTAALFAPVIQGVPDTVEWILALVAGLGLVLYVENFAAARRLAALFEEAPPGAEEDLKQVTESMRRAEWLPLAVASGALLLIVLAAPLLYFPISGGLVESLEARGLVGAAAAGGVLATGLGVFAYFRHRRPEPPADADAT